MTKSSSSTTAWTEGLFELEYAPNAPSSDTSERSRPFDDGLVGFARPSSTSDRTSPASDAGAVLTGGMTMDDEAKELSGLATSTLGERASERQNGNYAPS